MTTFSELTEEEAVIQLESGKISGYIRIPDGFLDSIVSGQNMPVTFVGGGAQRGIGTQLMMELSDTVSEVKDNNIKVNPGFMTTPGFLCIKTDYHLCGKSFFLSNLLK